MTTRIWELEINRIRPNYRLVYEEEVILRLCDDIRAGGLQEPIVVELVEFWFRIIDGEKRWRAYKKLGLTKISAIILEASLAELNNT
jgi:ParB-like chromosome segregation protein Spo0J